MVIKKFTILFLFLLLPFYSNSNQTTALLKAIEECNPKLASQSIEQGADINFHEGNATTWTPLMKSIAHFNNALINFQLARNTYHDMIPYPLGAIAISGIASAIKKTFAPLFITGSVALGVMQAASFLIKKNNEQAINDYYTIITLLLNESTINKEYQTASGMSAYSLCQRGYDLLHSKVLEPPYTATDPQKKCVVMLKNISNRLPAEKINRIAPKNNPPFFRKKSIFKKYNEIDSLPIVFHPEYDITFGGIENLHPFDTKKYGSVAHYLVKELNIDKNRFYTPTSVTDDEIALVHEREYIQSLTSPYTLALITEMPIAALMPSKLLQKKLLNPV